MHSQPCIAPSLILVNPALLAVHFYFSSFFNHWISVRFIDHETQCQGLKFSESLPALSNSQRLG